MILGVACSFGGGGDGTASPTTVEASATGTAAVAGSSTPGPTTSTPASAAVLFNARPVEVVAGRIKLPSDLALVVSRSNELWRIHRAPNGEIEERLLFDPFAYSGNRIVTFWNIHHLGAALTNGQLAIAVCTTGECGGLGPASEDALITVFRSTDGGVSWSASEELDGVALIAAGDSLGALILQRLARVGDSRTGRYELWPSGRAVDPPTAHTGARSPIVLDNGVIGWWAADGRLIDDNGATLLNLGDELTEGSLARRMAVLPNADRTRLAVTWIEMLPNDGTEAWRWSIYDLVDGRYEAVDIFEAAFQMIPTAWIDSSRLLINGDFPTADAFPRLPAILDVVAGTVTAIEVPGGTLGQGRAVALQVGPFAEIDVGAGDCLNLRTEADLGSGVLRCIADGVLLERLSPLAGGWVNVRTSDGVVGWASGEFVRRARPAATPSATAEPVETAQPSATAASD